MSATDPEVSGREDQRAALVAFRRALSQEARNLSAHDLRALPQLTWQQMSNRLRYDPAVEGAIAMEEERLARSLAATEHHSPLVWFRATTQARRSEALLDTLEIHDGEVWACRFSPDGTVLASVGEDLSPRLTAAGSWTPLPGLDQPEPLLTNCCFSADGVLFAASSAMGTALVWEWRSGRRLHALDHHSVPVSDLAFSPDGQLLVTTALNGAVTLWEVGDGRQLAVQREHQGQANCCSCSPDGTVIVTGGDDGTLRLWDGRTGGRLAWVSAHSGPVTRVRHSPDGLLVASSGNDGTVKLFDARTGSPEETLEGHRSQVWSLAFSPDGRLLASCGSDHAVRVWDVATRRILAVLRAHAAIVSDCDFSPDGRTLASCDKGRVIRLWDLSRPMGIGAENEHQSWVLSCRFSPDGRRVVSSDESGNAVLWSAEDGRALSEVSLGDTAVGCVDFAPDGRVVIASGDDGAVRIWDTHSPTPRVRTIIAHRGNAGGCAASADGSWIVSGGADETLRIMRTASAKSRSVKPGGGLVYDVAVSADASAVALSCGDGSVELRDIESGKLQTRSKPSSYPATRVEFLGTDSLVCSFHDGHVRVLSRERLEQVLEIAAHRGRATGCSTDSRGTVLASSGEDRSVRLWNPHSGELVGVLCAEGDTRTCAVSPAGDRLAYGDTGGNLIIGELRAFPRVGLRSIRGCYDTASSGSRRAGSGAVAWSEIPEAERAQHRLISGHDQGAPSVLERLGGEGLSKAERLDQSLSQKLQAAYESRSRARVARVARRILGKLDNDMPLRVFARAMLHMLDMRFSDAAEELHRFLAMDTAAPWHAWAVRVANAELEGMGGIEIQLGPPSVDR